MRQFSHLLLLFVLLFATLGASNLQAVYDGPLDVIVHGASKVEALSAYELESLFTRTQTRWSDGSTVIPLSFPMSSEPRVLFDRIALRLDPDEVGRFWLDRRIRGMGTPPKQVPTAALMLQVVANLRGAIGYLPASRNHTGVRVVAHIAQGKVVPP
jgi:hypothetical protein